MLHVDLFESEAIAKFAYNPSGARLVIFFKSGGVYEYRDVPWEIFEGFRAAASKGQHFQTSIRGQFAGRVLAPNEIAAIEAGPGPGTTRGANLVLVEIARLERVEAAPVFF